MNGHDFSKRVRGTLARAREEAVALGHEFVGCEHMLLALLASDGVGVTVLRNLGVDLMYVAARVTQARKRGILDEQRKAAGLPYTSPAKRALELAMSEARELQHSTLGTEHLLLGLLREERGIAAQVLRSAGGTVEGARAELLRIVGLEPENAPTAPMRQVPIRVSLALHYSNGVMVTKHFSDASDAVRFLGAP